MANKLKSSFIASLSVDAILKMKGATLENGFLDEHDREAMRQGNAISRQRMQVARRLGKGKRIGGCCKPINSVNAA